MTGKRRKSFTYLLVFLGLFLYVFVMNMSFVLPFYLRVVLYACSFVGLIIYVVWFLKKKWRGLPDKRDNTPD